MKPGLAHLKHFSPHKIWIFLALHLSLLHLLPLYAEYLFMLFYCAYLHLSVLFCLSLSTQPLDKYMHSCTHAHHIHSLAHSMFNLSNRNLIPLQRIHFVYHRSVLYDSTFDFDFQLPTILINTIYIYVRNRIELKPISKFERRICENSQHYYTLLLLLFPDYLVSALSLFQAEHIFRTEFRLVLHTAHAYALTYHELIMKCLAFLTIWLPIQI